MKRLSASVMLLAMLGIAYSQAWQPDLGNGEYQNPVIYADYSDPDVCRVGDDYYMTSSSFNCVPALQILHSKDLVNWEIIGSASPKKVPLYDTEIPQYGKAVWAPSIRWHEGKFYIFYGDPDNGIVRLTADSINGEWEEKLIVSAKGYIDPCPLWDEDGRVWLVHALAKSRAGMKSVLLMAELDSTASEVKSASRIIFDGHETQPTCEGPKLYKRNGYYYIFTPAGGVRTGWQTVLRSKNIYGPYEEKIVLRQGKTDVNGPHQGAWISTPEGEDWFMHFQDRGGYGRIVHLQPMTWDGDWPVMGNNGEPISRHKKPTVGKESEKKAPQTSDEFDCEQLGWQWQWMAQPKDNWWTLSKKRGILRLYSQPQKETDRQKRWLLTGNLLAQKFPARDFCITTRVRFNPGKSNAGEEAALVVSGKEFHSLSIINTKKGLFLGKDGKNEIQIKKKRWIYLRLKVKEEDGKIVCQFEWSKNGKQFEKTGDSFTVRDGNWIGCKAGLCCNNPAEGKGGWMDADWWRVE